APEKREEALKALFDPKDGAKFNICRVPIGASDYAVERYTLNEAKDDYEMKNFSIEHDRKYLIPYIKAAMQYRPDLKVWGSDWTPPTWMKTSNDFDGGSMKDDPKVYAAFALYLAKFVEAYQAEGINLFAAAVQNEPTIDRHYPSCLWTRAQFRTFVRDYMGPTFKQRKVNAQIMLGTFQSGDYFDHPTEVLDDKEANRYISIVGYQWDGLKCIAQTRKDYPDKKIMQTETECGNWYWKPGYNPDRPQNDWFYGSYTWKKVKDYFDAGVNSYMLWNMILDEEGKSIDAQKPWPQDAAVVVDKNTKTVIYTPMYYAFKHFSYFIEPGAHYLKITKGAANAIAFKNPDGKIIIELENSDAKPKTITIGLGSYRLKAELPANSFNTIDVPTIQ
ncbi:MAG TPA: glycoside hydrolase family 30 protein, partial [Bacillota bacterium]|nr:glycoside hydrolase family 30 protein [Bacillota bacterium]